MTFAPADQQILVGAAATLRAQFADQDGDVVDPGGTVSVVVTDYAGAEVFSGAATKVGTGTATVFTADIDPVDQTDRLAAVWTSTAGPVARTSVEVVGGYYASISAIREADRTMQDENKFSREQLLGARRFVEEEFERFCGRAFVPRFTSVKLVSCGERELALPNVDVRSIRSVTVDGSAVDASSAVLPSATGVIRLGLTGVWPSGEVVIGYEHGMDRPPTPLVRAFYTRVRNAITNLSTGVPDRASTYSAADGGTYALLTAGRGGSITALPEVDVALREYEFTRIGIA